MNSGTRFSFWHFVTNFISVSVCYKSFHEISDTLGSRQSSNLATSPISQHPQQQSKQRKIRPRSQPAPTKNNIFSNIQAKEICVVFYQRSFQICSWNCSSVKKLIHHWVFVVFTSYACLISCRFGSLRPIIQQKTRQTTFQNSQKSNCLLIVHSFSLLNDSQNWRGSM